MRNLLPQSDWYFRERFLPHPDDQLQVVVGVQLRPGLMEYSLVPVELAVGGVLGRDVLHPRPKLGCKMGLDGGEGNDGGGQTSLELRLPSLDGAVDTPELAEEALDSGDDDGEVLGVAVRVIDALGGLKNGYIQA